MASIRSVDILEAQNAIDSINQFYGIPIETVADNYLKHGDWNSRMALYGRLINISEITFSKFKKYIFHLYKIRAEASDPTLPQRAYTLVALANLHIESDKLQVTLDFFRFAEKGDPIFITKTRDYIFFADFCLYSLDNFRSEILKFNTAPGYIKDIEWMHNCLRKTGSLNALDKIGRQLFSKWKENRELSDDLFTALRCFDVAFSTDTNKSSPPESLKSLARLAIHETTLPFQAYCYIAMSFYGQFNNLISYSGETLLGLFCNKKRYTILQILQNNLAPKITAFTENAENFSRFFDALSNYDKTRFSAVLIMMSREEQERIIISSKTLTSITTLPASIVDLIGEYWTGEMTATPLRASTLSVMEVDAETAVKMANQNLGRYPHFYNHIEKKDMDEFKKGVKEAEENKKSYTSIVELIPQAKFRINF